MDLHDLLTAFGYGQGGLGTSDYGSAVAQGRSGTDDPQRAGLAPSSLSAGGATSPRVLAQLSPPGGDLQSDAGLQSYSQMPVAPQDQSPGGSSPPAMPPVQQAQYAPPMPMGPQAAPQPSPSPMMPQSLPTSGNPYSPLGINSDKYAKLLEAMFGDVASQQQNRGSDALLRFGLATMAAGGKPMSTTLGAIGEGGLAALNGMDEGRAAQLKALLGGAQISNTLGEAAIRNARMAPPVLPSVTGAGSAGANGAPPVLSGSGVSAKAPQGPLSLGQIKGLTAAAFPNDPNAANDAAAIIMAESQGDPNAKKEDKVENSYGLTQINANAWGPIAKTALGDPEQAVKIMRSIYDQHGGSFNDWSTYKNGDYKRYLPRVEKADAEPLQMSGGSGGAAIPTGAGGASNPLGAPVTMDPDTATAMAEYYGRIGNGPAAAIYQKYATPPEGTQFVRGPDGKVYAQPVGTHTPEFAGKVEQAKEGEKIQITRDGAVYKGGVYIGHAPKEVSVTDATGAKYPAFTPPMGAVAPGMAHGVPGTGGPISGAPGASTAPGISTVAGVPPPGAVMGAPSELGPGQKEALTTRAKEEQETRQHVINDATIAQQQQASFQNMKNEASNFIQGPFAPHAQEAAKWLRYISPSFDGQVASYEDFTKNAGIVLRQVTREVSSREAVQGMQMFERTLPSAEMSPAGLNRVIAQFQGLNDFKLVKAQAQQDWEQQHGGIGNVSGFETAFQKQVTPLATMFMRLPSADQAELAQKLSSDKDGLALKAKLIQQINYLKSQGYDSVIQ